MKTRTKSLGPLGPLGDFSRKIPTEHTPNDPLSHILARSFPPRLFPPRSKKWRSAWLKDMTKAFVAKAYGDELYLPEHDGSGHPESILASCRFPRLSEHDCLQHATDRQLENMSRSSLVDTSFKTKSKVMGKNKCLVIPFEIIWNASDKMIAQSILHLKGRLFRPILGFFSHIRHLFLGSPRTFWWVFQKVIPGKIQFAKW